MALVVIAYAHSPENDEDRRPLAVLAQDAEGVVIEEVHQDVEALARGFELPSQVYVGWSEARRAQVDPFFVAGPAGPETIAVTDPRWLAKFAQSGYSDHYSYGPIEEVPGTAAEAIEATLRRLKPDSGAT